MKLLILGGTQFVGLHITEAALAAGHEVTLFNRGKTKNDVFPDVPKIIGNRDPDIDEGLSGLATGEWDAVLDVNGYTPRIVRASAELLKDRVKQYVFISTVSVYDAPEIKNRDENAPLLTMPEGASFEAVTNATYGALKVLCEQIVEEIYPDRSLIIRPGFIVGPHDHTDRFNYWVRRVAQGGEMLAVGTTNDIIQYVDGRDLAAFTLAQAEKHATGIFNVTGPADEITWAEVFANVKAVRGTDTTFTWVDRAFLNNHDIKPTELPMIMPPEYATVISFSNAKAQQAGLTFRPFAETVNDLLAWDAENGKRHQGFTPEREAELLNAWHNR